MVSSGSNNSALRRLMTERMDAATRQPGRRQSSSSSRREVHQPDVRALLDALEHDLAAIARDVEVVDDDVAAKPGQLTPRPPRQVECPEILVLDLSAQDHELRSI